METLFEVLLDDIALGLITCCNLSGRARRKLSGETKENEEENTCSLETDF